MFLLAAGHGRRAGGPKAWRAWGGASALERHLAFLASLDLEVSVSIQEAWLGSCLALSPSTHWIGVDPERPPLSALQALVARRPSDSPGFVYHVDMPLFERGVFEALGEGPQDAEAWVPVHQKRRGHPVLLSARLYPKLLRLDGERDRLDHFLRSRRAAEVPVPWACVLANLNR